MASIHFGSKEVFDLYREMCDKTRGFGEHSLDRCMSRLLYWGPEDSTINVYRDSCDKLSFYFVQKWDDWRTNPDHEKMSKGVTMNEEEAKTLQAMLNDLFGGAK